MESEVDRDVAIVAAYVEDVLLGEDAGVEGGEGEEAGVEDVGALVVAGGSVTGCTLVA